MRGNKNVPIIAQTAYALSEDYEKFDEIAPFTENIDPSIQLNDEDFP